MDAFGRSFNVMLSSKHQLLLIKQLQRSFTKSDRYLSTTCAAFSKTSQQQEASGMELQSNPSRPTFMTRFESQLETRYPKLHKLYLLLKQGGKAYYVDTKMLYRVSTALRRGKEMSTFSYNELDVYRQMPRDLLRAGPIVVLLNIPITDMIMPFLVYMFPRQLLCRHFWTPAQQFEFGEHYLQARVQYFPEVLRCMEAHATMVLDPGCRRRLEDIISKLKKKHIPSIEEIVDVRAAFRDDQPFGCTALRFQHRHRLSCSMGFSPWASKMSRQAVLLHHTDMAIIKEGVESLSPQQVKDASFLRGLNAAACSQQQATEYLDNWMSLSKHVDASTLSLLLHSPVLLAMNHPANSTLL